MLLQIREFFRLEKIASNQQLARFFHVDLSALEPMLEIWLRRGVLAYAQEQRQVACKSHCARSQCSTSVIYYRYVDPM